MNNLRHFGTRMQLRAKEIQIVRGICRQIDWYGRHRFEEGRKRRGTTANRALIRGAGRAARSPRMRLIRYGEPGREQPGLWRDGRTSRCAGSSRTSPTSARPSSGTGGWSDCERSTTRARPWTARLGPPVTRPSKIVCLGINYAAHGSEGGFKRPERPILFAKTPNTLNGPFDPIRLPRCSGKIDWEVELAVIVGRKARASPATGRSTTWRATRS